MIKAARRFWEKHQLAFVVSAFVVVAFIAIAYIMGLLPLGGEYSNLAFLVIGVVLSVFLTHFSEALRRPRERTELARALYSELADRLARCCFDYEEPWSAWIEERSAPNNVDVLRVRKFTPFPPIVYPATASKLALLNNDAQQALITFYATLDAYRKDMNDIADRYNTGATIVPGAYVARIAERLLRTLPPGYEALQALGEMVDDPTEIDAAAIRYSDTLFDHKRSHLPLRQRIEYYLTVHRRKASSQCWHFCTNCSQWPTREFVQSIKRPRARELCNECKELTKNKKCGPLARDEVTGVAAAQ